MLYTGHIPIKAINNSFMCGTYVEQKSVSITVGSFVHLDGGRCPSTGKCGGCVIGSVIVIVFPTSHG